MSGRLWLGILLLVVCLTACSQDEQASYRSYTITGETRSVVIAWGHILKVETPEGITKYVEPTVWVGVVSGTVTIYTDVEQGYVVLAQKSPKEIKNVACMAAWDLLPFEEMSTPASKPRAEIVTKHLPYRIFAPDCGQDRIVILNHGNDGGGFTVEFLSTPLPKRKP